MGALCALIFIVIGHQLYRIWECDQTKQQMDWWIEKIAEVDDEVGGLDSILCAAERPEFKDKLNERLVDSGRHVKAPAITTPYKGKDVGVDAVKRHLAPLHGGQPDIYLCHDAHRWGIESSRRKMSLPLSMEEELESFVWMDPEKRVVDHDKPDPNQEDHAMDNLQWACLWHEHIGADDWARAPEPPPLGEDVLGLRETFGVAGG